MTSKQLLEQADSYGRKEAESSQVADAGQQLRQQEASLERELRDGASASLKEMAATTADGGGRFSQATHELMVVRTKLGLLPQVHAAKKMIAAQAAGELRAATNNLRDEMRRVATDKLSTLKEEQAARLLDICGGDADRASKAAAAILPFTELSQWARFFDFPAGTESDAAQGARAFAAYAEKFLAGGLISR